MRRDRKESGSALGTVGGGEGGGGAGTSSASGGHKLFHCCLSVVSRPEEGDFPENIYIVLSMS